MVDVVVDQKAMEKAPYDPAAIPEAVRKRVAAVEAMYAPQPEPDKPSELPSEPVSVSESSEAPVPQTTSAVDTSSQTDQPASADLSKPVVSPPSAGDENTQTWKDRYLGLQGRYTSAQKTIGEMQEQMTQLGNELLQVQHAVSRHGSNGRAQPAPPPPSYLTEQDVQNYGSELVDFTQRAAAQAIAPKLQEIEQQNTELRKRLAEEARFRLDQAVEMAVPNFREVDRDPRWHRWLLSIDLLSGRVRQQLLNEAIASANAPRVISFFKGFQQEEVATGHIEPAPSSTQAMPVREPAIPLASLAAPGRARPATGGDASAPSDKPIYTRAQIKQLYADHRRGVYAGRDAEWNRQDADIIAASREGRIR